MITVVNCCRNAGARSTFVTSGKHPADLFICEMGVNRNRAVLERTKSIRPPSWDAKRLRPMRSTRSTRSRQECPDPQHTAALGERDDAMPLNDRGNQRGASDWQSLCIELYEIKLDCILSKSALKA
jgi:hypothetical protein